MQVFAQCGYIGAELSDVFQKKGLYPQLGFDNPSVRVYTSGMKAYSVTYTPKEGMRDSREFTSKKLAERFALKQVKTGSTKVFMDIFSGSSGDEHAEYEDFKQFN